MSSGFCGQLHAHKCMLRVAIGRSEQIRELGIIIRGCSLGNALFNYPSKEVVSAWLSGERAFTSVSLQIHVLVESLIAP